MRFSLDPRVLKRSDGSPERHLGSSFSSIGNRSFGHAQLRLVKST